MKRTNTILLALLIGFTLGIYFGYRIWHKINTTNMIFGPSLKMIPYVTGGEILKWNQPVDMTIGGLSRRVNVPSYIPDGNHITHPSGPQGCDLSSMFTLPQTLTPCEGPAWVRWRRRDWPATMPRRDR